MPHHKDVTGNFATGQEWTERRLFLLDLLLRFQLSAEHIYFKSEAMWTFIGQGRSSMHRMQIDYIAVSSNLVNTSACMHDHSISTLSNYRLISWKRDETFGSDKAAEPRSKSRKGWRPATIRDNDRFVEHLTCLSNDATFVDLQDRLEVAATSTKYTRRMPKSHAWKHEPTQIRKLRLQVCQSQTVEERHFASNKLYRAVRKYRT